MTDVLVRDLKPGDVLTGSGFVVESAFLMHRIGEGGARKVVVVRGKIPGEQTKSYEWSPDTVIRITS